VAKRTIEQVDVSGKRVLMRVDFNVPLQDGVVQDDRRVRMALPTITSVVERGGRVILMSHLGRPGGEGYEEMYSLRPVAETLAGLLGRPVGFPSTDCSDAASEAAVNAMADGDVLLLENLRFHKGEKTGDAALAATLASYGEIEPGDRLLPFEDPNNPGFFNDLSVLTNDDFTESMGLEVKLDKAVGNLFLGNLSYSYLDARGTGSDPWTYWRLIANQQTNLSFLTGEPARVDAVLRGYGVGRARKPDGEIDHLVVTFLIDPDGQIVRRYLGLEHTDQEILQDIQSVARE